MERYIPRLRKKYDDEVVAELQKRFGYKNPMQVPRLTNVAINLSMKDAIQNVKMLETAAEELSLIAGQKAVISLARISIANFMLREMMPSGARATLDKDQG